MKTTPHQQRFLPRALMFLMVFVACLSAMSAKVFANPAEPQSLKKGAHIVFLISEDPLNYEAAKTIPPFAERLKNEYGFKVSVLLGEGKHGSYRYNGLEALQSADLLVVFCRRLALPFEQMDAIKNYLRAGKPVVGLRTANHGFSVWDEVSDGFEGWWGFVPDILGCENRGYEAEELGTIISIAPKAGNHPILKGIDVSNWKSKGQVYKVTPLVDKKMVILLNGHPAGIDKLEPIAWTRQTAHKSKVFFTSLGYPDDFDVPSFQKLIINGIQWALDPALK